jgi:hypothetical protein
LQGKNLKDFPRLGDRYKLQDTTLAGVYYIVEETRQTKNVQ